MAAPADTRIPSTSPIPLASPNHTGPSSPEASIEPPSPVEAGLRLITERLDVPAALLFASDAAGALRVVAAVGTWGGDALALQGLAETLGRGVDVLDVTDAIEGARFAAGARLGGGEGALLVLAPDDRTPGPEWNEAFAASAQLALGLVRSVPGRFDRSRLLHEVAVHPGTFEERLDLALHRAAEALGLDGAAFAQTDGGEWIPRTVYDPSGRLIPVRPVALAETFCAVTSQSDGPFAVEDAAQAPLGIEAPTAYLGAPVFVGGRCVGTFSVVGHVARPRPFSDDDRALVESLARWVGSALHGQTTARQLADREADLTAFCDGAPMGMGVARLLDGDLEFVRVNAAGAAALGSVPDALAGRRVSEVGGRLGRRWLAACNKALADGAACRIEVGVDGTQGARTLATTVSHIAGPEAEGARFTFVVEDVTDRRRAVEGAREREAQIEALVAHAPVALFATDAAGRLAMSRGRNLDLLGLAVETSLGRPLADLFASASGAGRGVAAALAGRDASWTAEAGDRTFEVRVQAHERDGRPVGLIGVALDVTDRQGGARAAARARGALLKHLDHEIRSPLTSILGYADLLSEETPPDELVEVRDVIARAGERLLAALDELTLLGDDVVVAHPAPTDACEVVAAVAEASRSAAEASRIALNLWCTLPEGPLLLDAALFERIARHLVSGAVASAEGACVDVRLRTAGPDAIELSVTGGVPGDALGLGARYVPRLAEAMGGSAAEAVGERPGWVVRLPRQAVPVVELATADGAAGEAPTMALAEPGA